jgi:hypothetical protein
VVERSIVLDEPVIIVTPNYRLSGKSSMFIHHQFPISIQHLAFWPETK